MKATPSTSKHGYEGGHIDDLSDDDELDSLMHQKYQKLGRMEVATLKGKIRRGNDFENKGFVKEQRGNYMQGEDVGKGGPKKERVSKDAKEPPKNKAKISPAKLGQ